MTRTPVKAVFFDAVGTLIHPDPPAEVVYTDLGHRFGISLDLSTVQHAFRAAFTRQEQLDRAAGWKTSETREIQRWRTIVGEVLCDAPRADACFAALYEHFSQPSNWRCEPGLQELFGAIRQRGCQVGLASNFDRRLRRVVAGLPALAGLEYIVISSEVGWRKPAAEFFAAAWAAVNSAPQQILHVGDHQVNDYEGARAAGCSAILVDPNARLPSSIPTISNLAAVPNFL